jgi:ABC-type lipoprotein release transport system permease subunit
MLICGSAVLICLLAGLIPALIASRLQPVEALRHE